ncbi:MAG: Glu-tRNA(Gln) amidotransferase subunit GatE [Thermoplasmata archaeon]|nr:Glu-tRNA(Gln) amidotransferase subunit GatE [Thermoplasmata archaeon]MCI4362432.1 Glu-tRNA(Gln) amidotransferase subunit GatE [Thermoplasmata archaeon]
MKAGLEVHQQLSTGKLFCDCPAELSETVTRTVERRLRATGGENHAIDAAAAFQASRNLTYIYEATPTSCLVELDEEPPNALDPAALDVALTMALLLGARPLDEVEVMRKIVVDGSNTSGFQRTALVAVDGHVDVDGRSYSIPTICLEEDAARKVGESKDGIRYRLDRLGIPLIEIATGPEISNGAEARAVAEEIGMLLRATGKVRRGIGTIREDVNVSTEGGARVEVKGVQELRKIHQYVDTEVARQVALLAVREKLTARRARVPDDEPADTTHLLRGSATGPLGDAAAHGGVVLGIGLPGFGGLLAPPGESRERLGRELADRARAAGVRGLFHSDEVPSQGIDGEVVSSLRRLLGVPATDDAFVLVGAPKAGTAHRALHEVRTRAREALAGIPSETRDPLPDGRTRYSRPLPGRDRMYPETDVPPVPVDPARLRALRAGLPERPREARARLVERYALSENTALALQRAGEVERFESLAGRGHAAPLVAQLLAKEIPDSGGDDEPFDFPVGLLDQLLASLERGEFAKEGLGRVVAALAAGAATVPDAIGRSGLVTMSRGELEALAEQLVLQNAPMIAAKGPGAFSPLMGDLMREVRGRRDGQEVAEVLRSAVARKLSPGAT